MYYPYFRGKQFELILLRDNAEFLAKNNICPIIEPVKTNVAPLERAIAKLKEFNVNFTLIINPKVGDLINQIQTIIDFAVENLDEYDNFSLGYIMTEQDTIDSLIKCINKNPGFSFSIIHYGFTKGKQLAYESSKLKQIMQHIFIDGQSGELYQSHFNRGKKILIRDGFSIQKNADYPPSEHFSELHLTYSNSKGMQGFGDFLMVGDDYSESGGPAYAVAIHLTYLGEDDVMFIYHFKSDRKDSPADPAGKFLEALKKLIARLNESKSLLLRTEACKEF